MCLSRQHSRFTHDSCCDVTMHRRSEGTASRRLTNYLLHEFIDGLENDLAVLLDSEAPELWLLLMKDGTDN
jgi:hypothetical protein